MLIMSSPRQAGNAKGMQRSLLVLREMGLLVYVFTGMRKQEWAVPCLLRQRESCCPQRASRGGQQVWALTPPARTSPP